MSTMDRIKMLVILTAAAFLATGCAAEETARTGMLMIKDVTLKCADRIPIDSGAMAANASLNNPHYRVMAAMINGVYLDVGLDGVVIQGNMQAQGEGAEPVDQDLREKLNKIITEPNFWDKLIEASKTSTAPSHEG